MVYKTYEEASEFELRFWLQVLGDHARFIHGALAQEEKEELDRAARYIQAFDGLLSLTRSDSSVPSLVELNKAAYQNAQDIRFFKLHLLQRHLAGTIKINLPPTFLNHMVNEAEEALSVMHYLQAGQIPPQQEAIHHHLVWLQDAFGHSAAISAEVDPAEKGVKETSEAFTKQFEAFYLKAIELAGYMRTGLRQFPALRRFNKQVELEMLIFGKFLDELKEMRLTKELLGTLLPLMADHMAREECYYLTKLSWVSEVAPPDCDPGKPRTES